MKDKFDSFKKFKKTFPWGSDWDTSKTPKYAPNNGKVVGWIWDEDSYGVVLDNKKWYTIRSYAPSLLRKKKKK